MHAPTAVALPVALVACGADLTSPDMTSASGDYALRTVNNFPLPTNGATFFGTIGGVSIRIEGEGLAFRYIK